MDEKYSFKYFDVGASLEKILKERYYSSEFSEKNWKENNIKINFIKIDTLEKSKNALCIFNNWANFYKGEFISNTILNANSFKKLID